MSGLIYSQKNASFYEKRGVDLVKSKQFDKAVLAFDTAISMNSGACQLYYQRAMAKYYLKKYEKAIDDYTKSITLCQDYSYAYSWRGISKVQIEDYNGAISDFDSFIKIAGIENHGSGYDLFYYESARANYIMKNYSKALDHINKCFEFQQLDKQFNPFIHTHTDEVYFLKGAILLKKEKYTDAIKNFDLAIRNSKNKAEYYLERGKAKLLSNQNSFAIMDFNEAVRLAPKNHEAYYYRGEAKWAGKDSTGACEDLKKAVSNGNNVEAKELLKKRCDK